ncbi:hypothetical protein K435DRAFT_651795, partial [Dendrothele bispora CBS 962.96]
WRQFSFFDAVSVKDVHDLSSSPEIFKTALEISTIASSSTGVLVADIHGSIHLLNQDFESISSWVAHAGGRVTHMIERKGFLVTLGEESSSHSPLLKIWDLNQKDKRTKTPLLVRSIKVQPSNRPHPASSFALSENVSHLAIGLGDGSVLLYRHLDQSLASSTSLTALPKPRTVHESPSEPITGLGFREPSTSLDHHNHNLYLFVVTTDHVLVYQASGKGAGSGAVAVDEIGCRLGCAVIDNNSFSKEMVIARDEAIYICGVEGRGNAFAYEGSPKSSIHIYHSYLVIVSPPVVPSVSAASATVRNFARVAENTDFEITKVTVFDPGNRIVAYTGTFTQGIREVIVAPWGGLYVLGSNGEVIHLLEKPTSEKLEMLYRRSMFGVAVNLARTQGLDENSVADIHRQYGDHLYTKGDYDGAMNQYLNTMGCIQPSYVIRKFLDAQRIHNLVTYLQELHSQGLANSDHTTLLLNTYTKLKDVSRLDAFIKAESKSSRRPEADELPFDLDTAIRVCRQAGYFEHAGYLAKKYERHEEYLRIQIEDAEQYVDALAYLRDLGTEAAENNLARYGRALLANLPKETTQLLIDLCTLSESKVEVERDGSSSPPKSSSTSTGGYLAYLNLNRNSIVAQTTTVSSETATIPVPSIHTVRPGDSNSVHESVSGAADGENHSVSITGTPRTASPPPSGAARVLPQPVKRLSPRLYFAHFIDHMEQFVIFLETVALRRWGQSVDEDFQAPESMPQTDDDDEKKDQIAVWNTLLELYLTLPGISTSSTSTAPQDEKFLRAKALRILKSDNVPYDPTHALILCSSRGHTDGLVLLWEKMGMYEDVLRFWMDRESSMAGASAEMVKYLKLYGAKHPHLYALVLRFLTSSPALLSKHQDDVKEILEHIDQEGIMPPLGIIQVLSRNEVASIGLVKAWLIERIQRERGEIQTDQEWIQSYRMETAAKLEQVEELSNTEHPKVFHVTRCSSCGGQLDLPSVHFMCNHSYHQRQVMCVVDHDTECPKCAREHGVIREIRKNNEQLADQHELFISEIQEGGFNALANAFSRGIFQYV